MLHNNMLAVKTAILIFVIYYEKFIVTIKRLPFQILLFYPLNKIEERFCL